jgi:hypothetical protein
MTEGKINMMVRTVRKSAALYALAKVGQRRRKVLKRIEPSPLTHEARVQNYADQTGWTTVFTPQQRRRLKLKDGHALAIPRFQGARPVLIEIEEVIAA